MESWTWFVLGAACFGMEPFLPYLIMTPWGTAAFLVGLLSWLWPSAPFLIFFFLFLFFGGGLHLTLRPLLCYVIYCGKRKSGIDGMKNRKVRVREAIRTDAPKPGSVRLDGVDWRAMSGDGADFEAGDEVVVLRVEGSTLFVGREVAEREEPMPEALWPKMKYIIGKGSAYWIRS